MKHIYRISRIPYILSLIVLISFLLPHSIWAQQQDDLGVTLFVSCVEDLDNGNLIAWFGYENHNDYEVAVKEKESYIAYNYTRDKKYVVYVFEPGVDDRAFSQEFVSDDWVRWTVKFSNKDTKIVTADVASVRCEGEPLIVPYYTPPTGGKLSVSLIGAELNSLYEKYLSEGNNFHPVSDDIFQIEEGINVYIEVVSLNKEVALLVDELNDLNPGFLASSADFIHNRAAYWFPISRLIELNDFTHLNYARPVFTGINDKIEGQGDIAMRSDYTRMGFTGMGDDPNNPFYLDGTGVRVGVISNSYNTKGTASLDVDQEDLPGAANELGYTQKVEVLKDIITPPGFSLSDEGRAMMQIVHDVAPGAELVFRTGYLGELDMAQGIRDLANPTDEVFGQCDIIVDDITYITEPFFRDGIISNAIDYVVDNNSVSYYSSAGNFGNYSYEDVFQGGSHLEGIVGEPHNFGGEGPEDLLQLISLDAGTYTLVLQWDDGTDPDQAVTDTDLDIFLTHDDGTTLFGFNRVNIGGAPVEVLPFTVLEDNVFTNIVITRAPGPDYDYIPFKYVVFRGGSGFHFEEDGHDVGSSTIVGHANAEGTMAVGAVRYHHTPAYGEDILVEDFSSWGGTPIMTFTAGMPPTNPIIRNNPDFTAPDGVNTSVNLSSEGGSDYVHSTDTDDLPNFFGTSAAAPHAAGAAALIIQARRSFDQANNTDPLAIKELMQNTAIGNNKDSENNNIFNNVSGYGFIQPYAAIRTFANPKPEIDSLVYPNGVFPGETPGDITFTVKGNFYIDEVNPAEHTEIHFRGEELTSGVEIIDENTIVVTHSFLGNPAIQAVNPPTLNGGPVVDGGSSDPIYFSDKPKTNIVITARSFVKKYGENLPYFSTIILEDEGNPDPDYNVSIAYNDFAPGEKERIRQRLSFDVKATPASAVAIYDINLDTIDLIPVIELDHAIAEKYNIELVQGHLTIHKLAIKITPKPATIVYGHELTQDKIVFDYDFDSNNIDPSIIDNLDVKYNNPLPIGVPMVNGIALVRGTALVNNSDGDIIRIEVAENEDITLYLKIEGDDEFVLVDMAGPLPRGIALVNGQPFVQIEEIIDGEGLYDGLEVTFNREDGNSYITHLDGIAILDEQNVPTKIAVKNGIALVRGTALVNGVEVEVKVDGTILVNGIPVVRGTALVNGVPIIRGTALVNSEHIIRGTALVNGIEVPVTSGIPDVGVNGINPRGIALVNGIPLIRGTALVNGLNVVVDEYGDIEVSGEEEEYAFVNGIALVRGTALVNGLPIFRGVALVNGKALVRGVALVNDAPTVDILDNMNFLASTNSLDYLSFVNGSPLVNDMPGIDGANLSIAATANPDVDVNYARDVRGIALVNGRALVRGTALVNVTRLVRGTALVNTATISDVSNEGAIVINHEAEESSSYIPVTFITGTDAGTHSIIPGTFLSNNFDISYGLGELTIVEAELSIAVEPGQIKIYGHDDPTFKIGSYTLDGKVNDAAFDGTLEDVSLYGSDVLGGPLTRAEAGATEGENVGFYDILRGDLSAGENYNITFTGAPFEITQSQLTITPAAGQTKIYGHSDPTLLIGSYTLDEFDSDENFDGTVDGVMLYGGDLLGGALTRVGAETTELEDVGSYEILQGSLSASNNYNISITPDVGLSITQSQLTITPAAGQTKIYGHSDPTLLIGSYTLDEFDSDENFDGTVDGVMLYGGDLLGGALTRVGAETTELEDVGSYDILGEDLIISDNYIISFTPDVGLSITQSQLTITPAAGQTKIYGHSDPTLLIGSYTLDEASEVAVNGPVGGVTLYGGDVLGGALTRVGAETTELEDVGSYDILGEDLTISDNYLISFTPNVKFSITLSQLTITPAAGQTKIYGQDDPTLLIGSYTLDEVSVADFNGSAGGVTLYGGDVLGGALTRDGADTPELEDVETYEILQGSLSASNNYNISITTGVLFTINQASLEVTAHSHVKKYGEGDPGLTYEITDGILYEPDIISGSLSRDPGKDVKTYSIYRDISDPLTAGANYALTFISGTLTINQASLEVTAHSHVKKYGEGDPGLTYEITDGILYEPDIISGSLSRDPGKDVKTYSIYRDISDPLTAGANYALTFIPGTLTINQASLEVTAHSHVKKYGEGDPGLTYEITDGILYEPDIISGSLSRDPGKDVKTYSIYRDISDPLTAGANYALTFISGTLTINQASLEVTAHSHVKKYGEGDPGLTYEITDGILYEPDNISGSLSRVPGKDVGTYSINRDITTPLTAGSNYALTFISGTLTINEASLEVTADSYVKIYGEDDPDLSFKITGGTLYNPDIISGSLSRVPGKDVGTYSINRDITTPLTAGSNYALTFISGTLTIDRATLTITPDINGKDYYDDDPPLTIKSYELNGVLNGPEFDGTVERVRLYYDDKLTGSYSFNGSGVVGPYYDAIALETPAITDINGTTSKDGNYNIDVQPSWFYINPYGPGTRAIKPVLNCVERMIGTDLYIANLEYKNDNYYDVYIPIGDDNRLAANGISLIVSDEGNQQPTLFKAGGGFLEVYFDGTELSWIVNSLDEDHKASNAANANSSSTKCKKDKKSASISGAAVEKELEPDYLNVYPNPVTDKVHITMKDIEHYKTIMMYDMTGRQHHITSIDKRTDNLEIDMAQLPPGYYIFKIVMEDSSRVVQIIKE